MSQLPTIGEPSSTGVDDLWAVLGGRGLKVGLDRITDTATCGNVSGVWGSPDLMELTLSWDLAPGEVGAE